MKFKFPNVLSQNNTAPFMVIALAYVTILSIPFLFFLNLKGQPHTSRSVHLKEYTVIDKVDSALSKTLKDSFVNSEGIGYAQLNEFDDDNLSSNSVEIITKNVKNWKEDADSRGFLLLTRLAIFSAILAFGALGAAISLITRTRNNELAINNITILEILSIQTIGAVFATILGLTFMGNLLSGAIFPNPSIFYHIIYVPPALAKLLVWSFIAGFFERFVPNVLNNLVKKTENVK